MAKKNIPDINEMAIRVAVLTHGKSNDDRAMLSSQVIVFDPEILEAEDIKRQMDHLFGVYKSRRAIMEAKETIRLTLGNL